MKNLDNVYTLIDQYLNGEMDGEAKAAFERQLAQNPVLREELELQKDINETILDEEVNEFANLLSEIDKKIYNESKKISGNAKRWLFGINPQYFLAIAAAVAVIFGIVFFLNANPPTADEIYQDYYLNDSKIRQVSFDHVRAGNNDMDSLLEELKPLMEQSKEAYEQQDAEGFELAISYLQQLVEKDTNDTRIHKYTFYMGLCYMGLDKQPQAVEQFDRIISNNDPTYTQEATWLRSISLFKAGNEEDAKAAFLQIKNDGGYFAEKAANIIRSMDWE
ncbi:MAG: hypothetical protein KDD63_18165 [Bacteroidetes bacterium]|nr:hypothetical protein [Bacteroidota bacterium]MCB0842812.1 hypothetical protein [Bacteroidota bacterium]MCB0854159.1 hypothetical protein [Bacteroidota bacterium]